MLALHLEADFFPYDHRSWMHFATTRLWETVGTTGDHRCWKYIGLSGLWPARPMQ